MLVRRRAWGLLSDLRFFVIRPLVRPFLVPRIIREEFGGWAACRRHYPGTPWWAMLLDLAGLG